MIWFIVPVTIVLWLLGGQVNKALRRFALPTTLAVLSVARIFLKDTKRWWLGLLILLYIPILSIGYGIDSALGKLLGGKEWLVRLVYGFACALPVLIILVITHMWYKIACIPVLIGVFELRLGSIKIGNYDLLLEDLVRATTLGACITWVIY